METVPRLYRAGAARAAATTAAWRCSPRPRGAATTGEYAGRVKTGIMVGLGETADEVYAHASRDIRGAGVEILTIGQYLQPTPKHLPVDRWVHPGRVRGYQEHALSLGFAHCEAGPLVRSSYHAHEHVRPATSPQPLSRRRLRGCSTAARSEWRSRSDRSDLPGGLPRGRRAGAAVLRPSGRRGYQRRAPPSVTPLPGEVPYEKGRSVPNLPPFARVVPRRLSADRIFARMARPRGGARGGSCSAISPRGRPAGAPPPASRVRPLPEVTACSVADGHRSRDSADSRSDPQGRRRLRPLPL